MVYSRDRKMQNGPIKALLMSVIFMFHSFQDNPRDIFQNCFIVTGRRHVLKHGNKIKANLILVPSVGSTLSLPQSNQFPVHENWFPNFVNFFNDCSFLKQWYWLHFEISWNILSWSWPTFIQPDQIRERRRWRPELISPSIIGDHISHPPNSREPDTGDWRESPFIECHQSKADHIFNFFQL